MREKSFNLRSSIIGLSSVIISSVCFADIADVHGRNLLITGLGWVGHVGLESANSNYIYEMLGGSSGSSGEAPIMSEFGMFSDLTFKYRSFV